MNYNLKQPLKAIPYEKGLEDGFAKLGPRDYPEIIKAWFPDAKMDFSESFMVPYINYRYSAYVIAPGDIIILFPDGTKLPFTQELCDKIFEKAGTKRIEVKAYQDDCGHWYLVPVELAEQFRKDLEDEEMADSGEFDAKYGQYMTGGDLNRKKLYTE